MVLTDNRCRLVSYRPSNTEGALICRAEASTHAAYDELIALLKTELAAVDTDWQQYHNNRGIILRRPAFKSALYFHMIKFCLK